MSTEIHAETQEAPSPASAEALFELGLAYANGHTVSQDYVAAHKWFNLAALKGLAEAKTLRAELAREMAAADVHEAQRQARAWLTLH